MKRARLLLADDHDLTLAGTRACLERHYEIVGEAMDGAALVKEALRLEPDLIVLDISMPVLNGIDAAKAIGKSLPKAKLLFLTMYKNPAYLSAALQAGATGYVLKTAAAEELLEAVGRVLSGRIYVSPGLSGDRLERFGDPGKAASAIRLSPRERQVIRLIAEGRTAAEIGALLNITAKTVTFHRATIVQKLGLSSTADITRYVVDLDLD